MLVKTIFIIPYRDREPHKKKWLEAMEKNLSDWDKSSYKILFIHQLDYKPFNRGAMKNIGFLVIKNLYPDSYKDITIIFHDVDTWAESKNLISYKTTKGKVAHYYGYDFALGGMVGINCEDFERTGGFPNLWGWGIEDNTLQDRCINCGLIIDRSNFYEINDYRIMRMYDGNTRLVSIEDPLNYRIGNLDGLNDISNLSYNIIGNMVNVTSFTTGTSDSVQKYREHDIRLSSKLPVVKIKKNQSPPAAVNRKDLSLSSNTREKLVNKNVVLSSRKISGKRSWQFLG